MIAPDRPKWIEKDVSTCESRTECVRRAALLQRLVDRDECTNDLGQIIDGHFDDPPGATDRIGNEIAPENAINQIVSNQNAATTARE